MATMNAGTISVSLELAEDDFLDQLVERVAKRVLERLHAPAIDERIAASIREGLRDVRLIIDPEGVAKLVAVGNAKRRRKT